MGNKERLVTGGLSLDEKKDLLKRLLTEEANRLEESSLSDTQQKVPDPSAIIEIQSSGSKSPIFCVAPLVGLLPSYARQRFHDLASHLGPDQPFYGLWCPVSDGREENRFQKLEDIAAYFVESIKMVQPRGPYVLGGWCNGGDVAFEIAQQFKRQGQEVPLLILLDSPSPALSKRSLKRSASINEEDREVALIFQFVTRELAPGRLNVDPSSLITELQALNPDERWVYILNLVKDAGVVPGDTSARVIRRFYFAYRRAATVSRKHMMGYNPQVYPGRLSLFIAQDGNYDNVEPTLGWQELSELPIYTHLVQGNHMTMLMEPYVEGLVQMLEMDLEMACSERSPKGVASCKDEAYSKVVDE